MEEYRAWQHKVRIEPREILELSRILFFHFQTGALGIDTLLSTASQYEMQGEHWRAIETYMQMSTEHTENIDVLEESWEKVHVFFVVVVFVISGAARMNLDRILMFDRFLLRFHSRLLNWP